MKNKILIIIMLVAAVQLSAQTIINVPETTNQGYYRIGIEPTTMSTFGYQRNLKTDIFNRAVAVNAEWGTSMQNFGWDNSELKLGAIFILGEINSFKIVNYLNVSAGSVVTRNFKSKKFAAADEVAFGFYKPKWFIAATGEYEKIYLNHITHSDFYRTIHYADAKDGWYKGAGGMFQFGLEGGVTIRQNYQVQVELKMPFTEKFNSYGGSPLHVNLGFGYRF